MKRFIIYAAWLFAMTVGFKGISSGVFVTQKGSISSEPIYGVGAIFMYSMYMILVTAILYIMFRAEKDEKK